MTQYGLRALVLVVRVRVDFTSQNLVPPDAPLYVSILSHTHSTSNKKLNDSICGPSSAVTKPIDQKVLLSKPLLCYGLIIKCIQQLISV